MTAREMRNFGSFSFPGFAVAWGKRCLHKLGGLLTGSNQALLLPIFLVILFFENKYIKMLSYKLSIQRNAKAYVLFWSVGVTLGDSVLSLRKNIPAGVRWYGDSESTRATVAASAMQRFISHSMQRRHSGNEKGAKEALVAQRSITMRRSTAAGGGGCDG